MFFSQVPHTVLMVRPASFGYNPETAASNAFQKEAAHPEKVQQQALMEFDAVVNTLEKKKIPVIVVNDTVEPRKTDSIFPNNWITTHEDGKIILYPMMALTRRIERRVDIVELLREKYTVKEVIDLSAHEREMKFLEGTGSIIFDHPHKVAYACLSPRTDEGLFQDLCKQLGYRAMVFHAVDGSGQPIYHTNVMMWVGESVAGICLDSIRDEREQESLLQALAASNHKVVALSYAQMNAFAGNMFEVKNESGKPFLLLSQTAYDALVPGQLKELEKFVELLPLSIPTIEESGGGSIRCMVAGIYLPANA